MEEPMRRVFEFLIIFSILGFVACSSSKSRNDSDTVPDADIDSDETSAVTDDENAVPDEGTDSEDADSDEIEPDDVEKTDADVEVEELYVDNFSMTQECSGIKRLTKETVEVTNSYGTYTYQIDRYYDKQCRIKFESKYYPENPASVTKNRSYEYDKNGNVKWSCPRKPDGELKGDCQRFSYELNDDGDVKKMCIGKSAEGKETGCVRYTYDNLGRVKQKIRRSAIDVAFPFFRDFSDENAEYFSNDFAVSESVSPEGKPLSEELDIQEKIEYFYDDNGKVSKWERSFISKEFDENGNSVAVYGKGVIPDYFAPMDMTSKERVKYDYSDGLPVKSYHDRYAFFMDFDSTRWYWHNIEYEKEYSYDEKMRPVRIKTTTDSKNAVRLDDEWEYYSDGSLKRKRESSEESSASNTGPYYVSVERIYDKKGCETEYRQLSTTGEAEEITEKTYYDNSCEIKHEAVCDPNAGTGNSCYKNFNYTYEHDELGRVTRMSREHEEAKSVPYLDDDFFGEPMWKDVLIIEETYYKYTPTGKLAEMRQYEKSRDFDDPEALVTTSQKKIEIYSYDDNDRLVETRSGSSWNNEAPDASSMKVSYSAEYDSKGRLVRKNNSFYEYYGDTNVVKKIWNKHTNKAATYEYDENGNLVHEKLNGNYSMDFEYDEDGELVSATKEYAGESTKEVRTYFYETF
jgi:YD repeat-containing protein